MPRSASTTTLQQRFRKTTFTMMFSKSVRKFGTSALSRQVSLTFFTKDTCQLCKNAAGILHKTLQDEQFKNINLATIDIMKPENSSAFDKYCYDVPVLHVDRPGQKKPVKFMHYFDEAKLVAELSKGA